MSWSVYEGSVALNPADLVSNVDSCMDTVHTYYIISIIPKCAPIDIVIIYYGHDKQTQVCT